jgi:hypothetical protein
MGWFPRISALLMSSLIAAAEAVPLHELTLWKLQASGVCE